MQARSSAACATLRLPVPPDSVVEFETADGTVFRHRPGSLPESLRAESLWRKLEDNWHDRRATLTSAGAELGKWLYGSEASSHLRNLIGRWSESMQPHRIELRVPRELCDWPWEACTLESIGPPAVQRALTLTRRGEKSAAQTTEPPFQLSIELLGVELDRLGSWDPLKVGEELEHVRAEIEQAGSRGRFLVRVDPLGDWQELLKRCDAIGPPHIFHFVGHGLPSGRGLLFRAADGGGEEIEAETLALLLSRVSRGRQTRLAFLNACSTVASGKRRVQPFGSLGMVLLQHGIPMVIGVQAPLLDTEAQALAAVFYKAVAGGSSVDCAAQTARERLYLSGHGVGWAFLSLTLASEPLPLFRSPVYRPVDRPSAHFLSFGHPEQRRRLENFLLRRQPMVVVIHGEVGSGHRHVANRVQHDLEKAGNTLWRPVAELRWFVPGEKLLSRSQLTAGIARALGASDSGTPSELESRLSREIVDRCCGERVLVIDLTQVLALNNEAHAEALVALVHEVFADLMEQASQHSASLPVFLLLSVAYPKPLPPGDARSIRVSEQIHRTQQALAKLSEKKRLKAGVRVEVLPQLQQITEPFVAAFLEEVLELDSSDADSIAQDLVGLDHNETILSRVGQLLTDWESS